MSLADLVALAARARNPGTAVWPGELDTVRWMWSASPVVWQDEYEAGANYAELMNNPQVWGLTGASYTSPAGAPTSVTPGWTMGSPNGATLSYLPPASFGYRLHSALMTPLDWARQITDRSVARLDPTQALDAEVPVLARWADTDPTAVRHLDPDVTRRVVAFSRLLEQFRGADGASGPLSAMLGSSVALSWKPDTPYTRIVSIYAQATPAIRRFLRRQLPPHVNAELHAFSGSADYTGGAWTARYQEPDGDVPPEAIYAVTSTLHETVDAL